MRIDRLTQLADHLEKNVSDNQFDMGEYKSCGIGHAITIFHKDGLIAGPGVRGDIYPMFENHGGFDAAERFFELEDGRWSDIFSSWSVKSRMDCVKNIRTLVAIANIGQPEED
jgi:hypothetical protein